MEKSLLNWLRTFEIADEKNCSTFSQLADGVLLCDILAIISPTSIDVSLVKRDCGENGGNWVLKCNNLKRLIAGLELFFETEVGIVEEVLKSVEVEKIAKEEDETHIYLLVESILGAAVECDEKETFIRDILTKLDSDDQRNMMIVIEKLVMNHQVQVSMNQSSDFGTAVQQEEEIAQYKLQVEQLSQEISLMSTERNNLEESIKGLKADLVSAKDSLAAASSDRDKFMAEIGRLEEELKKTKEMAEDLHRNDSFANVSLSEDDGNLLSRLAEPSNLASHQAIYDEIEEKERENMALKKKIEEMSAAVNENRSLRDDNDVLREKLEGVKENEGKIDRLQKRLEAMDGLQAAKEDAQAKASDFMKTAYRLEEEVKQLKSQLERTKEEITDKQALQSELTKLQIAAKMREEELEELRTKSNDLEKRQQEGESQLKGLKEKNEELKQKNDFLETEMQISEMPSEDELLSSQLQQAVAKLEAEKESLQKQLTEEMNSTDKLKEAHVQDLQNNTELCIAPLQAEIKRLKEECSRRTKEIASMKISYENTMHELQKEQDKNVSLSMDLKEELAEVNRAFEKEKLNLTRELASLKEDLQLSANELKEKEEALVVAGVKIKEINQMVEEKDQETTKLRFHVEELQSSISHRNERIEGLQKQLEQIPQLKETLSALKEEMAEKENAAASSMHQMEMEMKKIKSELQKTEQQRNSLADAVESHEETIASLHNKAEGSTQALLQRLKNAEDALQKSKNDAEEKIKEKDEEICERERLLQEASSQNQQLSNQIKHYKKEVKSMKQEATEQSRQRTGQEQQLRKEITELQEEICSLKEEKELETKENDLQQKDITIAEKDRLLSEVKENAMKEKESFEGIIKNHEEAMRNLQRKLDEALLRKEELEQKFESSQSDVSEQNRVLQQKLDEKAQQLETSNIMCDNLEAEKEEEEKRNESLQTERDLLLAKTELLEKEKIEVENRLVSLQTERKIEQKKQESEQERLTALLSDVEQEKTLLQAKNGETMETLKSQLELLQQKIVEYEGGARGTTDLDIEKDEEVNELRMQHPRREEKGWDEQSADSTESLPLALQTLQSQVEEKNKLMDVMRREKEESERQIQNLNLEIKLLVSSLYEMGLKNEVERSAFATTTRFMSSTPQSLLGRKRMTTMRR